MHTCMLTITTMQMFMFIEDVDACTSHVLVQDLVSTKFPALKKSGVWTKKASGLSVRIT